MEWDKLFIQKICLIKILEIFFEICNKFFLKNKNCFQVVKICHQKNHKKNYIICSIMFHFFLLSWLFQDQIHSLHHDEEHDGEPSFCKGVVSFMVVKDFELLEYNCWVLLFFNLIFFRKWNFKWKMKWIWGFLHFS